jgi:hypothetical protein
MGLTEIEQILARLSTDEELRKRFVNDPFALGRELGLSTVGSRHLRRTAAARFNSIAASPRERRFVQVYKLLPLTHRVLKGRFTDYFDRYVAEHGAVSFERLFGDVLAFADYLEKRLAEDHLGSGWTLDILRFEKARIKAADPKRLFVVATFRHDISRLVRGVMRKGELFTAVRRRTAAVWWRRRKHGPIRYAVFNAPTLSRK